MADLTDRLRSNCGMLGEEAAEEIERGDKAYALLFKEHARLRSLVELIFASTHPYRADGECTFSEAVVKEWNDIQSGARKDYSNG